MITTRTRRMRLTSLVTVKPSTQYFVRLMYKKRLNLLCNFAALALLPFEYIFDYTSGMKQYKRFDKWRF